MSEMEYHKGVAREIYPELEGFELKVRHAIECGDYEVEDVDFQRESFYSRDLAWAAGKLFALENQCLDGPDELCTASMNADNTFSYTLSFYNGGTYFGEAITDALANAIRTE